MYSRRLALLASLLVLAAGCGGDGDEGDAEQPRQTKTTAGFSTYEVASAGFSIAVPSDWEAVNAEDVLDEKAVESMIEDNPNLAPFVDAISGPDSLIELIAFDPEVVRGFATNLTVIIEPVPEGLTREQYYAANVRNIERLLDPTTELAEKRGAVPAGETLVLRYGQRAQGRAIATLQYIFFLDGAGYILTYTTLAGRAGAYAETFEHSARSFRLG